MKTELRQPEKTSHTIQSKTKAVNQAPVQEILQRYQDTTLQMAELDEDELLQGKFETVQREILDDDELLQGKFEETSQLIELDKDEEIPLQEKSDPAQREVLEDEELLQGKFETTQREVLDDDELLQGMFKDTTQRQELSEEELLQGKFENIQRAQLPDDDELLQGKFNPVQQYQSEGNDHSSSLTSHSSFNQTGLPDTLKSGIENLSGYSMDDVHVHYNSDKPAQLHALAYTQGTDIHVAPGQEKHLPHEAWHVVQQKQGRVQPTTQLQGVNINDNEGLEREADVMGEKSPLIRSNNPIQRKTLIHNKNNISIVQRVLDKKDLEDILENIGDDEWLGQIVHELFEIYDEHKDTINYGISSQGGSVGFKDYKPFITIVKDKNFWKEDKIKRQSTILHELTHLAQVKSAKDTLYLEPKDDIDDYDQLEDQAKYYAAASKQAEWMTPVIDCTDKISKWLDTIDFFDIPDKQKQYVKERLQYALIKEFEQPTTMVDLYYYLKSMGLTNNKLYDEISLAAYTFFQARKGYMPL